MDPLGSIKEVFIVIVLILMNGLLAMLEMALVSARKSRLEQLADEGSSKAAYILKLAQEPTEFLSTVQIGITLVGIGTGVYSGAMLAAPLEGLLREISVLRPYAGVVSYTFVGDLSQFDLRRADTKKNGAQQPGKSCHELCRFYQGHYYRV